MSDVLWADISQFQCPVTESYPYHFLSFRANDGNYRDTNFSANMAWAKHAVDTGALAGFMTYFVYESNWQETLATFKAMVGAPHPSMAVMIDVESWSGRYTTDQSAELNEIRAELATWLGDKRRVVGYGNAGDLGTLWPNRGDIKIVLANYSNNPAFPNKLAHQYADNYYTPPFGPCDINSADGYTVDALLIALGLPVPGVIKPKPVPVPPPKPTSRSYQVRSGDTLSGIAAKFGTTWQNLARINHIADPNRIFVGEVLQIDSPSPTPAVPTYTVRSGDTLGAIASRFGTSWQNLARINHISNPNVIFVGEVIRLR